MMVNIVKHLQFSTIRELHSPLGLLSEVATSCREMTDLAKDLESEHLCSVMHLKTKRDNKTHQPPQHPNGSHRGFSFNFYAEK